MREQIERLADELLFDINTFMMSKDSERVAHLTEALCNVMGARVRAIEAENFLRERELWEGSEE